MSECYNRSMPSIETFVLDNGLPVHVVGLSHLRGLQLSFFLRDGSRWETAETNGIAHFTEHLVFGSNALFPSKRELALALADIGAAANGETGPEVVGFYLATRPAHLARAIEIFGSMICQPVFTPRDLGLERRIVLAEIGEELRKGSVEALLWPDHPLSFYISGDKNNVRHFSREEVQEHHQRFYVPENGALVVSGPVSAAQVRPLVEQHFGSLSGRFDERVLPAAGVAPSESRVRFATVKDMPSYGLSLAYRLGRPDPRQEIALSLLNTVLGASDTSRLFQSLRETLGLVYTVESNLTLWTDEGSLAVELNASSRHLKQALRKALQEIERLADEEISDGELDRAKEWQLASLEAVYDSAASLSQRLALRTLFGEMPSLEDALRLTREVRAAEVRAQAAQILLPNAARLFVQGPGLDAADRADVRQIIRQYARGT